MINLSIPVSHLFNDLENIQELSPLYDSLECRPFSINSDLPDQTQFHADIIQPIHELTDEDFLFLEKIADTKKDLEVVSFHCASNCKNPDKEDGIFMPGSSSRLSWDEMSENVYKNIKIFRSIFNDKVSLAIENNNFYNTGAYDDVTDPAFLCELVYDNNIWFLFDTAHARVSAHNLNVDYLEYRNMLPLNRTIQIQFCDSIIPESADDIARDTHNLPTENTIKEVIELCKAYNVKYITPEYYKDVGNLVTLLKTLRMRLTDNGL